jgi:hypothetical protein
MSNALLAAIGSRRGPRDNTAEPHATPTPKRFVYDYYSTGKAADSTETFQEYENILGDYMFVSRDLIS